MSTFVHRLLGNGYLQASCIKINYKISTLVLTNCKIMF